MKVARFAVALAIIVACLVPELGRYRAERELRRQTSIAIAAMTGRVPPPTARLLLARTRTELASLATKMPGDPRPRMIAGSVALEIESKDLAIAHYLDAMRCGERGEIDLNLGRAFAATGDERAVSMFVRAVWISPRLIESVPEPYRSRVRSEVESRARSQTVTDPPPLPVLPPANAVLD